MTVKSKKLRKIARNAALSALIVSAIVGTGIVANAATTDNVSRISSGTVSVSSYTVGTITAAALEVTGGTLYVDADYATNNKVLENNTKAVNLGPVGSNTNAWIKGGSVIVGQKADGTAVTGVTLTVDNMTIASGGTVDVTNNNTLAAEGSIDIATGGTLAATSGLKNTVTHAETTGAVNLRGGTITVGADAGLTIAEKGYVAAAVTKHTLFVATKGVLNSYGGTINANLNSAGKTSFLGGTTTVDNMTVSGGVTSIEGNATVNSKGDVAITDGVLEMAGGTLRMNGGAGTLKIEGGDLSSAANVNTIDGNVAMTSGNIEVLDKSTLNITKTLDVKGGTVSIEGGGTLAVKGLTTLAANTVTVGHSSIATNTGIFSITKESLLTKTGTTYAANTGIANNAITLNKVTDGGITTNTGVLILTGWSGEVDTADLNGKLGGVTNGVLGNTLAGNNIILMGASLTGVEAKLDGGTNSGTIAYGSAVTVNAVQGATSFTNSGTIIVPKLVAGAGVAEFVNATGSTTLVGTGATDSNTSFDKYTQNGAGVTTVMGGAGLAANTVGISAGTVSVESESTLRAGTLDMSSGSLNVLNSTANIGTLKSSGGSIFVDPAIVNIGAIEGTFSGQLFDSVGSIVTVGGTQGWLTKPMADAGFAFGGKQAVLGISTTETITIGTTGIVAVDPSIAYDGTKYTFTNAAGAATDATREKMGAFYAGNNTLTVLDLSTLEDENVFNIIRDAAVGGNNKVNIVDGAKLHVSNLTVDGVKIFTLDNGDAIVEDGKGVAYNPNSGTAGWAKANLIQPDRMLSANMTSTGTLEAKEKLASDALGMSGEFNNLMHGVWGNALNNTNSENRGIRLVSRAASTDFGLTAKQAAQTIEGAAQLGAVGAVQGVTIGAANSATAAVATRTSFAQPLLDKAKAVALNMDSEGKVSTDAGLSAGDGMKNGLGLWIMPLYQSNNVWGQKSGEFKSGYNSDLGGVVAGVDFTVNDMFRFGAALNIGAGYAQSTGDFNSTDNRFNFWGVNLYGGWTMNNFGLTADVGYTGNYNIVEQDAPVSLGMSNFKSDISSSAWTAGLKGEYKFETSFMDIIPHVGVRYMGLTTDQYDVKSSGGTAFDVKQNFQSIWTFPIGVAMSKTIETGSGWTFKPQVDLSVIPAAGDVKAKSKSRIPGLDYSAESKMQVVDYVTFDGGVGFDIANDNLSFGLNYNIQASEHRTGHGVFGTVRYEF